MREFVADVLARRGARRVVDPQLAADGVWVTNSPEVDVMPTGERGWSADRHERWLVDTWRRTLVEGVADVWLTPAPGTMGAMTMSSGSAAGVPNPAGADADAAVAARRPRATDPAVAPGGPGRVEVTDRTFGRLRWFNLGLAALHLVSGVAMVVLSNGFEVGVSSFWLGGPPGTDPEAGTVTEVLTFPLGPAVAAFMFLSALFHLIVALPPGNAVYRRELEAGRNRFRWVEYSLSATLMIVLIAIITGITGLAALIPIALANVAMILFGWVMEIHNPRPDGSVWWSPFWFGALVGSAPWIAIVVNIVVNITAVDGAEGPPGFVYGILVSIFVLFNIFAVNQWLQYRKVGPWRDYLVGEVTYGILSLVAKSALAWQVFANVLVGS